MHTGSREEAGTRLFAEEQFKEGLTQILVATEAAGEGINLQVCHIMVNYDIPWNPNRLEQRMGRIHRYGQTEDCLIFNFVATNTIEGRVLKRLLRSSERFAMLSIATRCSTSSAKSIRRPTSSASSETTTLANSERATLRR